MQKFADRHVQDFVTDYASSAPREDIAESFTALLTQDSPDGDMIADEKIRFFENHPELVSAKRSDSLSRSDDHGSLLTPREWPRRLRARQRGAPDRQSDRIF
jgi:hypothetical protein